MVAPVRKAVIPAAGFGTRFLPATKVVPKELFPLAGKPLIQWSVEEAASCGIDSFCLVINHHKNLIKQHFYPDTDLETRLRDKNDLSALAALRALERPGCFTFCYQDEPLGLGHAIWCAREFIDNEPFAVLLPDDFIAAAPSCLSQMMAVYENGGSQNSRANMAAVIDVGRHNTAHYGILDVEEDDGSLVRARGLVEKPPPQSAPSTLAIVGRYLLDPGVVEALADGEADSGGEIQLTGALHALIPRIPFLGCRFSGHRFDCGHKDGYRAAHAFGQATPT